MKTKKTICAAVSASIILSASAQLAVPVSAAGYTYIDYIGTHETAETFDNYNAVGWDTNITESSVTNVTAPEVGSSVLTDDSGNKLYPTYADGKTIAVSNRNSSDFKTAKYAMSAPRSTGNVCLNTDIGTYTDYKSGPVYRGGTVYLYDSGGKAIFTLNIPDTSGSGRYTVTGKTSKNSSKAITTRKARYDGLRIEAVINLDNDTANITLDYIAADNKRYRDDLTIDVNDTDIAGLAISAKSESSTTIATMLDNTQFYAEYIEDQAKEINVSYKADGTEVASKSIDISDSLLTAGDTGTYYVPAYIEGNDGCLYKTSSGSYKRSAALLPGITSVTENVTKTAEKGEYQFAEFNGSVPYYDRRELASDGEILQTGVNDTSLMTVDKTGIYDIKIATGLVSEGTERSGMLKAGVRDVSALTYTSKTTEYSINGKTLFSGDTLISTAGNSHAAIDYILITKVGSYTFPQPSYTSNTTRTMEGLDRGTYAVYMGESKGVYLSWRLLGTESLTDQAFDIYRDGEKIHTTGAHDATNWTDGSGSATSGYIVVPAGQSTSGEKTAVPINRYKADTSVTQGTTNIYSYFDIPISQPLWQTPAPAAENDTAQGSSSDQKEGDTEGGDTSGDAYTANDASVGDLDGDGDYELVLKWNPSNSKDNASSGLTSNVIIDAYDMGNTDGSYLWRIDLGKNIRAGAHYTQFIVYDLDGDGRSEVAMKTAPGSKDGQGNYVNAVMDRALTDADANDKNYRNSSGRILEGPEYLTIFDGKTGAALCTTDFIARGNVSDWGDIYGNRSDRFLAAVAYLNGSTPSLIMTRGYYNKAVAAAYNWNGNKLTRIWLNESTGAREYTVTDTNGNTSEHSAPSLYAQGNHSLGVCDADNDGKDEIVFGSAIIDDDGSVLNSTEHGHGDALHISDFNNDGMQEIFSVHENKKISADGYADELRRADDARVIAGHAAEIDNGRGFMGNVLDDAASLSQFWSSGIEGTYNAIGSKLSDNKPTTNNYAHINSGIYWDGDLARELLDGDGGLFVSKAWFTNNELHTGRLYWANSSYPADVSVNNSTKANVCLSADILGDWREEIIARKSDNTGLRVFLTAAPTEYRLYTLMSDPQYREGVAGENVGYNQPPHTSYYIGSAALASDAENGVTFNYLAPQTAYTSMIEASPVRVSVEPGERVENTDNGTWDAGFESTVRIPAGKSITADDISVTIGGVDAVKNSGFSEKFASAITGASVTFTVGITDIPSDVTDISDLEVKVVVGTVTDTAIFR